MRGRGEGAPRRHEDTKGESGFVLRRRVRGGRFGWVVAGLGAPGRHAYPRPSRGTGGEAFRGEGRHGTRRMGRGVRRLFSGSGVFGHFRASAPYPGLLRRPMARKRDEAVLAVLGEGGRCLRASCLHSLGRWCALAMRNPTNVLFLGGFRGFFRFERVALCASPARTKWGLCSGADGGWAGFELIG